MNAYLKDLKQFLKSIDTDFYLHLNKFRYYSDKSFDGDQLTLTELILIAESYTVLVDKTSIHNIIDIPQLKKYILHRIGLSYDKRLIALAQNIIKDMQFFSYVPLNNRAYQQHESAEHIFNVYVKSDLLDSDSKIKYNTYI